MIIADTDVLSALAKIGRVSILYGLFQRTVLYITPGVFKEIEHSFTRQRQYAIDLFALLPPTSHPLLTITRYFTGLMGGRCCTETRGASDAQSVADQRSDAIQVCDSAGDFR